MNLEQRCIWDKIARQEDSTTFSKVCYKNKDHPLHVCAYACDGYNTNCEYYKVLKIEAVNVYGKVERL